MEVIIHKDTVVHMGVLAEVGWAVTNVYGDGVVRMAKRVELGPGREVVVGVFLDSDGKVQLPHTQATHIAQTELYEAGIRFRGEDRAIVRNFLSP